ncbi:MAG: iron-containing alcohol dehydrogenase family protein [Lachnospiraceae bacterium]|uniref:iron-containing alcohol dehydrogenase family protein n=1 Tax=Parablautia sp. Marseille-Q6255 TaxID=3039593 RepID=UPI0024BC2B02|nr:iron-containing alcohol dehydrogenase [Parablautia sp. Marseille-Q6255]
MSFNFFVKSNITFGNGSLNDLSDLIKRHELRRVMVVCDSGVKAAGILEQVLQQTKKAEVYTVVFDEVIPNPTNEIIETAYRIARKEEIGGFIAVGGGSSIDTAKAVNILMTNPGTIRDYAGIGKVKKECLPLIAIPTTAGTSSEITNVSALIDTEKIIKYVIIDNKIVASDVIADPKLTITVPASVTAATGMDAITHAVESFISNQSNPLTEYHSLKGLQILYQNIVKAVEDGADLEAREQMMLGCIVTGFGFSNANLGLVHGIAHTLSAHFGLAHGMANAAVLPYVLEYNAPECSQKMAEMARMLGLTLCGNIEEDQYVLAGEMKTLIKRLGIRTLSEQKISREDFEMLADDVLREPVLSFNIRQNITKEDILAILEKAF